MVSGRANEKTASHTSNTHSTGTEHVRAANAECARTRHAVVVRVAPLAAAIEWRRASKSGEASVLHHEVQMTMSQVKLYFNFLNKKGARYESKHAGAVKDTRGHLVVCAAARRALNERENGSWSRAR